MRNTKLDRLVQLGVIQDYSYENLDEDGNVGESTYRNTERLTLYFPNDEKLTIDTLCSGCLENTTLELD